MAEKLTEAQINLLKEVASNNGIEDCTIKEYSMSLKGDNYLGQIICATIANKRDDKTLEVVVKKAPSNEDFRKTIPIRDIFLREIYIYDKIHATFRTVQDENGVENPFNSTAKYFGKCEEELSECLVLENLVKNGYGLWNRKLPMNSEHISLIMGEYGKFHAVSYALKEKNPELFNEISECLKQEPTEWEVENMKKFLQSILPQMQKVVEGNAVLQAALLRMAVNLEDFMKVTIQEPKEKMVITHGDCWCNNMLFKYCDPNDVKKPTNVAIIDWQMSRYGLPVLDIIYFFCTSSPTEILKDYQTYLKIYYENLSKNLKQMSCNPDEILSYKELEELWKKCARYGLLLGGFIFKILYVDSEDAPDVSKNTKSMEDFYRQFELSSVEDKVNARLLDVFNFMVENDFI